MMTIGLHGLKRKNLGAAKTTLFHKADLLSGIKERNLK